MSLTKLSPHVISEVTYKQAGFGALTFVKKADLFSYAT